MIYTAQQLLQELQSYPDDLYIIFAISGKYSHGVFNQIADIQAWYEDDVIGEYDNNNSSGDIMTNEEFQLELKNASDRRVTVTFPSWHGASDNIVNISPMWGELYIELFVLQETAVYGLK